MAGNPALRNYALSALILTFLGLSGQFVRQPTHSAAPSGPGAPIPARVTSDVCEDPTITSLEAFYNAKEPRTWWYMRPLNHFMPPEFNHEHIRTIYNIMMQPVGTERADARGWPRNDFLEEAIKDHIGVFQDPPAPGQTTPAHLSFDPKLKPADEATVRGNRGR